MLQTIESQRVGHKLATVTTTKCVLPPFIYSVILLYQIILVLETIELLEVEECPCAAAA